MAPPVKDGPKVNNDITARLVRLVGADGEMMGVFKLEHPHREAERSGLD